MIKQRLLELSRPVLFTFIQTITMLRGFFGNLIFAIIARMLCGDHLHIFYLSETLNIVMKVYLAILSCETTRTDQSRFRVKISLKFENLSPVDFSC